MRGCAPTCSGGDPHGLVTRIINCRWIALAVSERRHSHYVNSFFHHHHNHHNHPHHTHHHHHHHHTHHHTHLHPHAPHLPLHYHHQYYYLLHVLEQLPEETQQVHIVRGIVEAKGVHVLEVLMKLI